jgi:hypothetical protein
MVRDDEGGFSISFVRPDPPAPSLATELGARLRISPERHVLVFGDHEMVTDTDGRLVEVSGFMPARTTGTDWRAGTMVAAEARLLTAVDGNLRASFDSPEGLGVGRDGWRVVVLGASRSMEWYRVADRVALAIDASSALAGWAVDLRPGTTNPSSS